MQRDTVFCEGLELDVEIGFHEVELGVKQTVLVDLTLDADFRDGPANDHFEGLVDYYEISRHLERDIAGKRYKLVEALAVDIARVVLRAYPKTRVKVRLSKRPLDMPRARVVGVECVRTAADFPGEFSA
jgi:7,8-dihydroneopterin aldolase/epimerase/oxygenase